MKKIVIGTVLVVIVAALIVWLEPTRVVIGRLSGDAFFQSRPSRYWAQQLLSEDPAERERARQSLADASGKSTAVLRQMLMTEGDDQAATTLRWTSADLLGKIGPAAHEASEDLIRALSDRDPHVRGVAAAAIPAVETKAQVAVPQLIPLLNSEQRTIAARALSVYGAEAASALTELVRILRDPSLDTEARWNAARTLGKMRDRGAPAIPALNEALQDPASTVREHAAEALGDIGPPAAATVPALVRMFKDAAPRVRRDAARSVGQIGVADPAAIEGLKALLQDPESIVRDAAKTAITTLTGEEPEMPAPATDTPSTAPQNTTDGPP